MSIHSFLVRKKVARTLAAGCVALAAGGLVLVRAPRRSTAAGSPPPILHPPVIGTGPSGAPRVEFSGPGLHGHASLTQGQVLAHGTREVYAELRVAADARPMTARETRPAALAVVLDVSGSMSGEKLTQARNALLELVEQMRDFDQISLVTYSETARVLQPLARVSEVRARLRTVIPTIQIEGGTNIPAGIAFGVSTLATASDRMVRRVVLLSDGQDGSGRPLEQVTSEVRARADQGFTLSSLGIGADYDERFMSRVADAGRGNYEFLRDGSQLRAFLTRELQQATSTTVERAVAEVRLPSGWRAVRVIGAESPGGTGTLRLPIGALFAGDERRLVLALEVDASAPGPMGALAVNLDYRAVTEEREVHVNGGHLELLATASEAAALASRDMTVFAESEAALIAARQQDAVVAWRDGRPAEAQAIAARNIATLGALAAAAPAAQPALEAQRRQFERDQSAFQNVNAASDEGRSYGLSANARHRAATQRSAAY
jgi:Ca-activated chloride channel family protein